MNAFILRLLALFNPLWVKLGVHTDHLNAILDVKLKIDDRRPNAFNRMQQQKKKPLKAGSVMLVIMSLVTGGFYLLAFLITPDYLTSLSIYFTLFLVMLSVTLISDFTYVLLDVKDNFIILPKPVNDRTVLVARLLHILIHISKIVLPMTLPGLVYLSINTGLNGALMFVLIVVLMTLFTIFFINAVYLIILRLTTMERFKDIINGIQVVFSIFIFATYYFVPRMAENVRLKSMTIRSYPYFDVAPSLWFASLWSMGTGRAGYDIPLILMAVLALVVPFIGIWLVVKFLAPSFNNKLSALGRGSAEGKPDASQKFATTRRKTWGSVFSALLTKGSTEKTGFEIAWLLTGRNREFKLKVYPSFAYVICYFFLYGIRGTGTMIERWHALPQSKTYILLIYFSSMAMITAITNMVYSDKFKAAWVYYVSPVKTPGEILTGAVKAMLVKYFLPFYAVLSIFALYVWHWKILPDLLLGLINISAFGILMGFIYLKKMPFSAELNYKGGAGNFMKSAMILIVPLIVGSIHYFISGMPVVLAIFIGLSGIVLWMVTSRYRELKWSELDWK